MSDDLQFGRHPDPDQLTAFAEQALPLHEQQQMLAHLAACADCRRVVFLAQQAEPEVLPLPAPIRRPWFSGWNLAWPATAAFAAIIVFSVYLHTVRSTKSTARPVTTASVEVVASAPSMASQEAQIAAVKPNAIRKTAPPKPIATIHVTTAATTNSIHGSVNDRATDRPQVQDQQFIALARGSAKSTSVTVDGAPAEAAAKSVMRPAAAAPAVAPNTAYPGAAAPVLVGRSAAQRAGNGAVTGEPAHASPQPKVMAQSPAAGASLAQRPEREFRAAPPLAATPKTARASPTAVVSGASGALAATMNNATSMDMVEAEPSGTALPSHLPARSIISNGSRTVALDSNGGLFLSMDGGQHWNRVAAQWSGRAVEVGLVSMSPPVASFARAAPSGLVVEHKRSDGSGRISGSVIDATGAAVSGASVNLRAASGADERTTRTNVAGQFAVEGLGPGIWQVEISAPGFAAYSTAANVRAGEGVSVSTTLQVGSAAETVTVTAASRVAARPVKAPAFVLTTEAGVNWTSSDGQSWKRK